MLFFIPVISIALTAWRSRGATPLVLSLVREMVSTSICVDKLGPLKVCILELRPEYLPVFSWPS